MSVSAFWDAIWLMISTFVFIAYLLVVFQIVVDLFRDPDLSGLPKALWIIGLIFLPFLTAVGYILVRSRSMAQRQVNSVQRARSDCAVYIREVAGKSPAEQTADAKALLDAGTIDSNDFARLKAKAFAWPGWALPAD